MNDLSNDQLAELFLTSKQEEKAAKEAVSKYQKELASRLGDGDRVTAFGQPHVWVERVDRSIPYKKVLDWLHARVDPSVMVLIEEGQDILAGSRTTRTLKVVKG